MYAYARQQRGKTPVVHKESLLQVDHQRQQTATRAPALLTEKKKKAKNNTNKVVARVFPNPVKPPKKQESLVADNVVTTTTLPLTTWLRAKPKSTTLVLIPEDVLCNSSQIVRRLLDGTKDEKACGVLLSSPGRAAGMLTKVCQQKTAILDRDSLVKVFYYSVLPALLASRQDSWLLLRVQSGSPPRAIWEQEASPMSVSFLDSRRQVPEQQARRLLRQATQRLCSYALRIVVERKGSAHALLVLIAKGQAVVLDPNGTLQQATLCFGNQEVLLNLLKSILMPLSCTVTVCPSIAPLHSAVQSQCNRSYIAGGACTMASGAIALRAVLKGLSPHAALTELLSMSSAERTAAVTETSDQLIALSLACHVIYQSQGRSAQRADITRVIEQLSGSIPF